LDKNFIEDFITHLEKERQMNPGSLTDYKNMIVHSIIENKSMDEQFAWSQKQAYIAFGFMLFAAAELHVDACPMEGFIGHKVDELLSTAHDYSTVAILALGYRDERDPYAHYIKVRTPHNQLVIKE